MKPKIDIEPSKLRTHRNPDISTKELYPIIPSVMETDQTCENCGKTYSALTWKRTLWTTGNCIPCSEIIAKNNLDQENRGSFQKRKENFKKLCPQMYQDFKKDILPNPSVYEQVISWEVQKKGLLLIGDSRMGKTRCAWQLMKRIYCMDAFTFEAITELQFSHKVADFGRSEGLKDWMASLCKVKVLFIDDLGKAVMTERTSAELFYVFEERMSNNKPIIATMQIDPINYAQKISNRSGKEMADAILNRLKSHCEVISF